MNITEKEADRKFYEDRIISSKEEVEKYMSILSHIYNKMNITEKEADRKFYEDRIISSKEEVEKYIK
jgi:fructose-bisphosphate aldolase class 1